MDGLGLKITGDMKAKTTGINDANKLFSSYMSQNDVTQHDARKRTEFGYALADS